MDNQLVSIITPLFNSLEFFRVTYQSVIAQTYSNFEWIIVDDCSTDGSFELASELGADDSRVRVVRQDFNQGVAAARNKGLSIAKGRYVTFLDSDDRLDTNYLASQLDFMQKNGPLITASYRRLAPNSSTNFIVPAQTTYKDALKGNPISCLTTMYDRSAIGDVFFPTDLEKAEDYVFWLSILKKGFVAKGNQEVLATYVVHPNSRSRSKIKLIRWMYRIYRRTQGFSWIRSWYYVFRWSIYGLKKYKAVR